MPVPLTPPYLQFLDTTGAPLSYGTVETYAATTSTKKATYTDVGGSTTAPNPIQLNASGIPETGNGMIFIQGAYRIVVKDQFGNVIDDQPSVTSFTNTVATTSPFFQSFSGTGSQTAFTLSTDLGTDENGLMIFVAEPKAGFFQQFSGTGAQTVFTLSTAKGTDSSSLLVFVYDASLGDKKGFEPQPSTAYTINGTTLTFGTAPVTGTNNIYVMQPTQQNTSGIAGYISPSLYTVNGTALTFVTAPVSGTNNIMVTAPSTLAGAAAVSAAAADASATAAANSATAAAGSASSAEAFAAAKNKWTYSTTTTMADPTTGKVRFNNATLSSVTAIALSNNSGDSGNPDLSGWTSTWDDSAGSTRGSIYIFKDNANFVIYNINAANTDNSGWKQLSVNYLTKAGSFSNSDTLYFGFSANGSVTVTGGITALTGDVTASGSGSVAATLATSGVTAGTYTNPTVTFDAKGRATAASNGTTNVASMTVMTTTGAGTFTTPSDVTAATVYKFTLVGGGGGGGGATGGNVGAGGAGAGGTAIYVTSGLAASTAYTTSVGAGGASGTNGPTAGATGGSTTIIIGATTITAAGGTGGNAGAGSAVAGVAGGAATNGTINISGGGGEATPQNSTNSAGGTGGASYLGGGGSGGKSGSAGDAALAYGGGGGGAGGGSNASGGAGKQGIIIIERLSG